VDDVVGEVERLGCRLVEITGGEPLLQADTPALMERLLARGHELLVETGGHRPIDSLPKGVVSIVDVKCPASGESHKMFWPNLEQLSPRDEVKFVIADRADFDYACDVVARYRLAERAHAVLFSPVFGVLAPDQLARWILETRVPARLQLQVHKYIWEPDARGV
jgi:7-carboxy-7-deazaguanine synthase